MLGPRRAQPRTWGRWRWRAAEDAAEHATVSARTRGERRRDKHRREERVFLAGGRAGRGGQEGRRESHTLQRVYNEVPCFGLGLARAGLRSRGA